MRALVTGATGFIGSALVSHLSVGGWFVRAATRDATRPVTCGERVVVGNISAKTEWSAALRDVDVVFHLAGLAHLLAKKENATAQYEELNAEATENLAAAAASAGVRRFVYLSSAKVAGEASTRPFRESDPPQPPDRYASSKLHGEQLVQETATRRSIEYSVVRPPLVYGPRVRGNFLSLLRIVDRGVPLPLGRIDNRRSYIAVDNLVDALKFAASRPQAANQIFFVSDDDDVSTPEL
ncbi:MAG TPA: NAD-dependent epimerase/dehydratase family protein, partial [Gemmatimonadaceae bacterium]